MASADGTAAPGGEIRFRFRFENRQRQTKETFRTRYRPRNSDDIASGADVTASTSAARTLIASACLASSSTSRWTFICFSASADASLCSASLASL
eukprot:31138-Pelagococcus_subviridis.AAC.9